MNDRRFKVVYKIAYPTSVAIVHRHASRITAELGKIPVKKLQARGVERLLATMAAEGLSTSTIRGCRGQCWRGALDRAMRDRLVLVNAARLAEVPEGTVRRSRSMTTAQARQLLASDLTGVVAGVLLAGAVLRPAARRADRAALGRRGPRPTA